MKTFFMLCFFINYARGLMISAEATTAVGTLGGLTATAIGSSATATTVTGVVVGTAAEVAGVTVGATALGTAAGSASLWTALGVFCAANPFTAGILIVTVVGSAIATGGAAAASEMSLNSHPLCYD
jgi:hypothetical protein